MVYHAKEIILQQVSQGHFSKLPFCHERKQYADEVDYNEIEAFYKKMNELDTYFTSTEFKKKLFGDKNLNKYEYQPIVREDDQEEEQL